MNTKTPFSTNFPSCHHQLPDGIETIINIHQQPLKKRKEIEIEIRYNLHQPKTKTPLSTNFPSCHHQPPDEIETKIDIHQPPLKTKKIEIEMIINIHQPQLKKIEIH